VCQFLDIIILCPTIYLDYFWCIKYQYIYIYIKIGKEKEKGVSIASWVGGGEFLAQSGAGARRRGQMGLDGPQGSGDGAADAVGAVPHARERRGEMASGGRRRAVHGGESRSPVNPTAVPRRWSGS
jgi:hypothetical protein